MGKGKPLPEQSVLETAANALSTHAEDRRWHHYQCKLVTPMYGGGVEAGKVDRKMPIRVTAIRGQLRFWWRLLNRERYPNNSSALYMAERAIWGGLGDSEALAASKVVVRVSNVPETTTEPCADYGKPDKDGKYPSTPKWRAWAIPYALFPGQGQTSRDRQQIEKLPAELVREGFSWKLSVTCIGLSQEQKESVLTSLRWWATFGGVGARTRRGLGAVEVYDSETNKHLTLTEQEIRALQGVDIRFKAPTSPALEAWRQALSALREFRQGEGTGRNEGRKSRPGRSRWPEAAAVRKITGKYRVKADGTSFAPVSPTPELFPRGAFGMPIIFHFKGDKVDSQADPGDTELVPVRGDTKLERMASPLILRPYRTPEGKWRAAALKLPDDHVWGTGVQLGNSGKGRDLRNPKSVGSGQWWPLTDADRKKQAATIQPMQGHGDNPIDAFLDYFSAQKEQIQGAVSAALPAKPTGLITETRWEKAQIKYNDKNGTVMASQGTYTAVALGDLGKAIWGALSPQAKQKIRSGFYRAPVVVRGNDLLRVEETK